MLNEQKSLAALCFLLSTLFQQEVRCMSLWFQGVSGPIGGVKWKNFLRSLTLAMTPLHKSV